MLASEFPHVLELLPPPYHEQCCVKLIIPVPKPLSVVATNDFSLLLCALVL